MKLTFRAFCKFLHVAAGIRRDIKFMTKGKKVKFNIFIVVVNEENVIKMLDNI